MSAPPVPADGEDDARRAALRRAGQEYFDSVLKQASAGKDPFSAAPPPKASSSVTRTNRKNQAKNAQVDMELAAVGSILSKVKIVLIFIIFLVSSSTAMIFSKLCLDMLPAPATVLVVHMIPTSLTAFLAHSNSLLDSQPITMQGVRESIPFVVVHAGMALMVLTALVHMRVETVMGVTTAAAPVLTFLVTSTLQSPTAALQSLPTPQMVCVGVGFVAAVMCTAAEGPNTISAALWLLPWFALLIVEKACEAVQSTPEGEEVPPLPAEGAEDPPSLRVKAYHMIRKVLDSASGPPPSENSLTSTPTSSSSSPAPIPALNKMIYCNALPILPIAILAAIRQEGSVFTEMELHVHSIVLMGYSCIAGVGASLSSLLLVPVLSPKHLLYTTLTTQILTLLECIRGRDDALNLEGWVASVICVLAGAAFKLYPLVTPPSSSPPPAVPAA